MGAKSSRERSRKNDSDEDKSESGAPSSSALTNDRDSTGHGATEDLDRASGKARTSGSGSSIQRAATAGRVSGQTNDTRGSGEGYVDYDPGPDRQELGERYGIEVREGQAKKLQRLESEFGSERVGQWAEEGMTVQTMGKPRDMQAFRKRQGERSEEIPTDIERRNEASLQRNAAGEREDGPAGETGVPDEVRSVISSPGQSLDEPVQREMEAKMGGDFGDVRIHTGPQAAAAAEQINARAFTVGNHVAFNRGDYQPENSEGQRVLAHELTHVRQQTEGAVSMLPKAEATPAIDPDPKLEREAEEAARKVTAEPRSVWRMGTEMHVQPKLEVGSPEATYVSRSDAIQRQVITGIPGMLGGNEESSKDLSLKERLRNAAEGWGTDETAIREGITNADNSELTEVLKDTGLVSLLAGDLNRIPENNVVWDTLMDASNSSVPADSARICFEERFNIDLGPNTVDSNFLDNGGTSFEINGLMRIYDVFKALPPSHVANIDRMAAESTTDPPASGAQKGNQFKLSYGKSSTSDIESGAFTDPGDAMRGMNILDTTTAHELAHSLDTNEEYSGQDAFREISGWKEYGDHAKLVNDMEADMGSPFRGQSAPNASLTEKEKGIARKTAKAAAENKISSIDSNFLRNVYVRHGYKLDGTSDYRGWKELWNNPYAVRQMPLVNHIPASHPSVAPWYKDNVPYLQQYRFHLPYTWESWMRYDARARDNKMSDYQFRSPGEEFAELYATWHCSRNPENKVPNDDHIDWFKSQNLHQRQQDGGWF